MNTYLHRYFTHFEQVIHPAGGKDIFQKKKKRSSATSTIPKGSPDSLNIRELVRKGDSFRRNPAP